MRLELMYINDFVYAIQRIKAKEIHLGFYYIDHHDSIAKIDETYLRIFRHDGLLLTNIVMASSDPSLGLPLLPNVYKSTTNSELGSHHNIHTLAARISHIGQFMETHGNCAGNEKEWGETLRLAVKELLAATSKRYTEEDIHKAFKAGRLVWKNSYESEYGFARVEHLLAGKQQGDGNLIDVNDKFRLSVIRPQAIEVDIEQTAHVLPEEPTGPNWRPIFSEARAVMYERFVVDENNFVKIKNEIYA